MSGRLPGSASDLGIMSEWRVAGLKWDLRGFTGADPEAAAPSTAECSAPGILPMAALQVLLMVAHHQHCVWHLLLLGNGLGGHPHLPQPLGQGHKGLGSVKCIPPPFPRSFQHLPAASGAGAPWAGFAGGTSEGLSLPSITPAR